MLEYPRWKYILVATVVVLGLLFALPNVFGEDAALQVARKDRAAVDVAGRQQVEEALHGRGIGRMLLNDALAYCQKSDARLVSINTQDSNQASLRLYEGFGFRRVGRRVPLLVRELTETDGTD